MLFLFVGSQIPVKAQVFSGVQNFLQPSGLLNAFIAPAPAVAP
jgi:hypothetical protein